MRLAIRLRRQGGDVTSPTAANPQPAGALPAGTTLTTISIDCTDDTDVTGGRYDTSNLDYDSMVLGTLTNTAGNTWSATVTGLANGQSYTYYAACTDDAGNDSSKQTISFSVAAQQQAQAATTAGGGYSVGNQ